MTLAAARAGRHGGATLKPGGEAATSYTTYRQAQTGDLPMPDPACLPAGRCSDSRGRGPGLSPLIFPCLRTRKIPLDPPLRR